MHTFEISLFKKHLTWFLFKKRERERRKSNVVFWVFVVVVSKQPVTVSVGEP